jgi:hypothetical protein
MPYDPKTIGSNQSQILKLDGEWFISIELFNTQLRIKAMLLQPFTD